MNTKLKVVPSEPASKKGTKVNLAELDQKSMADIIGRDHANEHTKRVIYSYDPLIKSVDNPNSLKNIFKRLIKK